MFKFDVSVVRAAFAGGALALGVLSGGAASATQVLITNGQMSNPLVVNLSGAAYNGNVYDAPMQFTTTYGGVSNVPLLAFCVDVFHDIQFGPYSPALNYVDTGAFTTDSKPTPGVSDALSDSKILQVDRLVNYGTAVFNDGSLSTLNRSVTLAAVQGAIWQVVANENVTLASGFAQNAGVNATNFNLLVDNLSDPLQYANYFSGSYGPIGSATKFLTPVNYPAASGTQAFLFAVPEPSAWFLSILGIGAVGGALRSQRGQRRRLAAA